MVEVTFVRMAFFPGGTADHHAAVARALAGAPVPPGRLAFVAGLLDDGWQVVQVWRSREELDAFNAEHFLPALAGLGDAGFPAPPVVRGFLAEQARFTP